MTVSELIAKLQTMPQDATVIYALYSEYAPLDDDQIAAFSPEQRKIQLWKDQYMDFDGRYQTKDAEVVFPNVVVFPGN